MKHPVCVSCNKSKPAYLFELRATFKDSPEMFSDVLARIVICRDCVKDPISQQTIVSALIEDADVGDYE